MFCTPAGALACNRGCCRQLQYCAQMLYVINFSLEQNFSKCSFRFGTDCQSLHVSPPAFFNALLALSCKSSHGSHDEEGGDKGGCDHCDASK